MKNKKILVQLVIGVFGFAFLASVFFLLFLKEDEDDELNNIADNATNSWKTFNDKVPKKERLDITQNRGDLIDYGMEKKETDEILRERKRREQDQKSKIRLKKSDLGKILIKPSKYVAKTSEETPPFSDVSPKKNVSNKSKKKGAVRYSKAYKKSYTKKNNSNPSSKSGKSEDYTSVKRKRGRLNATPGWGGDSPLKKEESVLKAVVHEEKEIRQGKNERIPIRFTSSFKIGNCELDPGYVYNALVSAISGGRLFLKISIPCEGKNYALDAYDQDGSKGIYVSSVSDDNEWQKEIVDDQIKTGVSRIGSAIGVPFVGDLIGKAVSSRPKRNQNIILPSGKTIHFRKNT